SRSKGECLPLRSSLEGLSGVRPRYTPGHAACSRHAPRMATLAESGGPTAREPRHSRRRGRYLLVALGLIIVVGALAATKGAQIGTILGFAKRAKAAGPPPETVSAFRAEQQTWNETLESVGSIASARGVNISNDAPGIVSRIA